MEQIPFRIDTVVGVGSKNQFGIISQTKYVVRESLATTSYPMVWDETSLATHQ